jgi:hypothetical protein
VPNWCNNSLFIEGDENTIREFMDKVSSTDEDGNVFPLSFASIVPEPDYDSVDVKPCIEDSSSMPDWWNWRINHWGTKWDLDSYTNVDFSGNSVTYNFDTAWDTVLPFVDAAAKMFPTLRFCIDYYEPGMEFGGEAEWNNGKFISHTEKEIHFYDQQF